MPCRSLVLAGRRSGIPERTRGVGKIANAAGPSNLKVGERFVNLENFKSAIQVQQTFKIFEKEQNVKSLNK